MAKSYLPIKRLHSIEMSVHEASSWIGYLTRGLGFQHVSVSTGQAVEKSGTRRHLLACGDVRLVFQEPVHAGSAVRRFLEKHPEGISQVNFLVSDARKVEEQLLERHATCTDFVLTEPTESGEWRQLNIATPLGDVEFAFVESADAQCLALPGMQACGSFNAQHNPLGITGVDHLTSNVRTLMPIIAFYEHVLGFKRLWDTRFHSEDVRPGVGAGLTSIVMWHEGSGIKFANNEPLRPRFGSSQVQLYVDTNRGPGIQHLAIGVSNMIAAAESARAQGVQFLATVPAYYSLLPERLRQCGVMAFAEPLEKLAANGILVDGDKNGYLLQVFCRDQASEFGRPSAGPLLIELIQRSGCQGFGEGNFKAIFEATQKMVESSCG
jgi:4-hydroxyphenylpyruvate dioxygenase